MIMDKSHIRGNGKTASSMALAEFSTIPETMIESFNYYDFADLGEKWVYYERQFKNDSKHGKGKIKLINGYDTIEGEGTFYSI